MELSRWAVRSVKQGGLPGDGSLWSAPNPFLPLWWLGGCWLSQLGGQQDCWFSRLCISSSEKTYKYKYILLESESVSQSVLILCDPRHCSSPGFSVHGILQEEYWSGLPFPSSGIFQTQGSNRVSCIAGGFFTIWATREALLSCLKAPREILM